MPFHFMHVAPKPAGSWHPLICLAAPASLGAPQEYLPIEGLEGFRKATVDLLLGAGHPAIKEVGLGV